MAEKAFTLPECPNCLAQHEAVAKWQAVAEEGPASQAQWHCFACEVSGYLRIEYHVTSEPTHTDESPGS